MNGKSIGKCILIGILGIGLVFGLGYVTMYLWNWLMPGIFGLKAITWCEAFGLLILGKLLFGGFRGKWGGHCGGCCHRGRGHWKSRLIDKWAQMTPEEREKFKKGFGGKCGYPEEEEKTS
jgi:hypothetical protein